MLHYIQNKSTNSNGNTIRSAVKWFIFFLFKSKEEVTLIDVDMEYENDEENHDLYKDLDDLFI